MRYTIFCRTDFFFSCSISNSRTTIKLKFRRMTKSYVVYFEYDFYVHSVAKTKVKLENVENAKKSCYMVHRFKQLLRYIKRTRQRLNFNFIEPLGFVYTKKHFKKRYLGGYFSSNVPTFLMILSFVYTSP